MQRTGTQAVPSDQTFGVLDAMLDQLLKWTAVLASVGPESGHAA